MIIIIAASTATKGAAPSTIPTTTPGTEAVTSEASKSTTRATKTHSVISNTCVLVLVYFGLASLGAYFVNVGEKFYEFPGTISHVETLVFTLLVNVIEVTKHLNRGDVGAGIVYYPFATIFDEVLEELECLIGISQSDGGGPDGR